MDQSEAYANAPFIKDAASYPPRWAAAAAAFRKKMAGQAEIGLAYGLGPRERYDLFRPRGVERGTTIFVHGGYWRAFGRSDWSHLAAGALSRGWAVALVEYELCPALRISGITRQISTAVRKVAAQVEGPLSLVGHSAGGHLVARMLDPALLPDTVAARICAVVPISPLADLRPLVKTDMNGDLRLDDVEAAAESPVLMCERREVPVHIAVGEAERPAFLDQAQTLAKSWSAPLHVIEGRHHFDVIDLLEDPRSDIVSIATAG